jgi:hypothetical protein
MELRLTTQQQELLRDLLQERFPGTLSPEQAEHLDSIRAAHLAELEAYTPGPDMKVRITMLPSGGQEFYFPAAPFDTNATAYSLVWLVLFCIVYTLGRAMFGNVHPGVLMFMPVFVLGVFVTVVMGLYVLGLWFAPQRVTIENGMLTKTAGLLRRGQSLPVNTISSIHAITGSRTMNCAIRVCGQKFCRVGDGIRQRQDAEWVAMQMSRAAGVKPTASLPADYGDEQLDQIQTLLKTFEGMHGNMTIRVNGQKTTRNF